MKNDNDKQLYGVSVYYYTRKNCSKRWSFVLFLLRRKKIIETIGIFLLPCYSDSLLVLVLGRGWNAVQEKLHNQTPKRVNKAAVTWLLASVSTVSSQPPNCVAFFVTTADSRTVGTRDHHSPSKFLFWDSSRFSWERTMEKMVFVSNFRNMISNTIIKPFPSNLDS